MLCSANVCTRVVYWDSLGCLLQYVMLIAFIGWGFVFVKVKNLQLYPILLQAPNVPVFRAELTPVMMELGPEFQNLYQRITSAMSNIQSTHGTTAKTKELTKILDEW